MSNHTTASQTSEELRIVVGVEGSPCALRALEYAANQAANTGSILQIVTVYNGLPGYGPFTPVVLDEEGAQSVLSAAIDRVHTSHPHGGDEKRDRLRNGRSGTVGCAQRSMGPRGGNPRTRTDRRCHPGFSLRIRASSCALHYHNCPLNR